MKIGQKIAIWALASCAFLELAACSSTPSASSASSASSSPVCSAIINAIGTYAAEKFSPNKVGNWANQVVDATGTQITSLSAKEHSSTSSSAEKQLLSDEKNLYNDAVVLENDAAGLRASTLKVPGDLSSVTGDIKHVYTDCGQTAP